MKFVTGVDYGLKYYIGYLLRGRSRSLKLVFSIVLSLWALYLRGSCVCERVCAISQNGGKTENIQYAHLMITRLQI